ILPEGAPLWMGQRDILWNEVEKIEKRKDAQLAREIEIALPRELDEKNRVELVRSYILNQFTKRGMVADLNIHNSHASDGNEQPHAHILLTLRTINKDKKFGNKDRSWNDRSLMEQWRKSWSDMTNDYLRKIGSTERIDHRSLKKQLAEAEKGKDITRVVELDRIPQPKIGYRAYALEKRGIKSNRGNLWRLVQATNQKIQQLKKQMVVLGGTIGKFASKFFGGADDRDGHDVNMALSSPTLKTAKKDTS
ncbi:MAG TPA: MobA/MobL family protein, partial [Alphaproteobacteria bacterium]|nr:MobA/MobL family protein [Alphaproteobacteria bacterium]